ncbi:endo-1,4-beta-xylanase [Umezawaea sp. Da 62-37]|uniref:endo-1,4-beta-xylanase n=1 Tax=Umezawaea sp. Da 62-37 TaxID=3075927 RepID=UPI0028F6EE8C|nr:endo-1,4-beta-xylanase [Umezawaea sp. Da 62-37]WNV87381.1 endo-1,4-beta-xylanase [Umezawaea sp. Da 62-37]
MISTSSRIGAAVAAAVSVVALTVVLAPPASAATPLRDLAAAKGRYFGNAMTAGDFNDAGYRSLSAREAGVVTPGNEMKWDATEPNRGTFAFARGDQVVAGAVAAGQKVRGHTLVWHNQTPTWASNLSATELRSAMVNHITTVMGHYKGKVFAWDVVNEAFAENGTRRQSFWQQKLGDGFIADAFRAARAADPTAKLYYNDYNTDGVGAKSDGVYNMVKAFKQQGVPIDGVGLQAHLVVGQVPSTMQQNIQRLADLGVDVAVTELDIRMKTPSDSSKLAQQAQDYTKVVNACLAVTRCVGITTWGLSDNHSWIPGVFPGEGAALPFDNNLQPKPAYNAMSAAFGTGGPTTTTTTTTDPQPTGCTAAYRVTGQWQGGFQAEVEVSAGSTPVTGWTVTWSFVNGQSVSSSWNAVVTTSGGAVSARNADHNGSIAAGSSTTFGFVGTSGSTNSAPSPTCRAA